MTHGRTIPHRAIDQIQRVQISGAFYCKNTDLLLLRVVGDLRGPLELEVAEAVSVCWVEERARTIQVRVIRCCYAITLVSRSSQCHITTVSFSWQARGKFGLRTKSVHVHERTFLEEAERKVLSGALSQWQKKAESDAAAAALEVGIAEARLLHASSR